MSEDGKQLSLVDDTISTEGDILGSSASFTLGENSIHLRPKLNLVKELDPAPPLEVVEVQKKEQWWLKKSIGAVDIGEGNQEMDKAKKVDSLPLSSDHSSSMKDFLRKEIMCNKDELEKTGKDDEDTLAGLDKYQLDFDNATTDDDIGNILEEMSKIAGTLSPIAAESIKSKTFSDVLIEEQSVEELLLEAEKLEQENIANNTSSSLTRNQQLELKIFKMIDDQVNQNNDNSSDCKKTSLSPSVEILLENINPYKTDNTLMKNVDEQKVEVSRNFDIDDPILRHSMSEEEKKANEKRDSIQKEITDVEKNFFDDLIQKSKENIEHFPSLESAGFDQEDVTHLWKILQEKNNKELETISKSSSLILIDQFDPLKLKELSTNNDGKREYEEKELVSVESKKIVYELESPICQPTSVGGLEIERLLEESTYKETSRQSSRSSSKKSSAKYTVVADAKKIVSDKNELYDVDLTPRLGLFRDTFTKLKAEKQNRTNDKAVEEECGTKEEEQKDKQITPKSDDNEDFSFKNFKALNVIKYNEVLKDHRNVTDVKDFGDLDHFKDDGNQGSNFQKKSRDYYSTKTERVISSASEEKGSRNETYLGKSKSYDQLSKQINNRFNSSLENVRNIKSIENRKQPILPTPSKNILPLKSKIQSRTVTKVSAKSKVAPKSSNRRMNETMRPHQGDYPLLDIRGNQIKYEEASNLPYGGGDWKGAYGEETLEMLYQEERQRFMRLKMELEAEIETYKSKLKDVQLLHEQEMFSLKKQNILLKVKVEELSHINKKTADARIKYDPKIMAMQKELQRQENVTRAYEMENKKLVLETKRLQNELKAASSQQNMRITVGDNANNNSSREELFEKLKDLQEENVKLNFEVSDLRQKNADILLKNEDVIHQNSLLQEELEMIKDQLRAKNDFITDRLQAMTTNELELRKQAEDLKVELHSKTEQLKCIKQDYESFQQSVEPLEKEIVDLRTKFVYLQEKLQTAKNNCEREKQLTQKLKNQVIVDNNNITDLKRQIREMEQILKRKNPDSVSALILTANSEHEKLNAEKVKLLEERISYLESETKAKEDMAHLKLTEIQKKFTDMKEKYSVQVLDLEHKLKTSPREEKVIINCNEVGTQTIPRALESRGSESNLVEKINKIGPKSQNLKEDTHLIATIRGLKLELTNRDKTISKVTKDLQELQKTNRKLQKEREKLLNERRNLDKLNNRIMTSSDSKLSSLKMMEANDPNSNFYQNGLSNGKKLSSSTQKLFDPIYTENIEIHNRVKKLSNENEVLKEELGRINKDFAVLRNKRLQDLNLLQEEHEKEIALIVKEYSTKADDTKALKLQGQVNSQMAMISHLKQQIDKLQDYKDQVIILKAERDHLESKNRILSEKVKYLSTPSSQQLQLLQEKITILQQRHETRELSLQKLVRDLLRSRNQSCKDCRGGPIDKGKQQLCYFRQELDNILGTLQDLTSP